MYTMHIICYIAILIVIGILICVCVYVEVFLYSCVFAYRLAVLEPAAAAAALVVRAVARPEDRRELVPAAAVHPRRGGGRLQAGRTSARDTKASW